MKIVIPGGSGQVGGILARAFRARGDDVVVVSRSPGDGAGGARVVAWETLIKSLSFSPIDSS